MTEYAKCKTCGRDQLKFSLFKGACYVCTGALILTVEHDPECKTCKEARDAAGV